jgi:SulP family sulfate permease
MWDISGAFGDIGILLPIAVVLIAQNRFNPTALFLMAGLFYIGAAYYFKITMPVQPLKAMSAIAIAAGVSVEVINAAGISMGMILLLIAITGLSVRLGAFFPVSVVRGIQLGLGLILIKTAFALIKIDLSVAFIAAGILAATLFIIKRIPPLIPLLILAITLSLKEVKLVSMGPLWPAPTVPDLSNFWMGFTLLVLPQLGLTFGNAIIATEATGKLLYGQRAGKLNLKSIPVSMGIANLISGLMGGVPMCHGSGGLTAHRTFGATSERSGYIIGFTFILLALLLGGSVLSVVSVFPRGILGVLLCYVGIQHSLFIRDILTEKLALFTALTVALTGFITNNLTLGFLTGIGIHYALAGSRKTSISSVGEKVSFRRREPCVISRESL